MSRVLSIMLLLALFASFMTLSGQGKLLAQSPNDVAASTPDAPVDVHFSIRALNSNGTTYFEDVEVNPGSSTTLEIELTNWAEASVDLNLYGSNARNAPNGGFVAGGVDEEPVGSAAWIDLPLQQITLEAKNPQVVTLSVDVPEGTAPGQYISAIVAETVNELPVPGEENLQHRIRYAISVGILVPGELEHSFEIGPPTTDGGSIEIPVANTGNVLVRPVGEVTVLNSQGEAILNIPVEMRSVYSGNSTHISLGLSAPLPADQYTISVQLTDPDSDAQASIIDGDLTLVEHEEESPVKVLSISVSPNGDPIMFANIDLEVENHNEQFPAVILLKVLKDGELVEEFPLATNQIMLEGINKFSSRYIPTSMWESGTYTFSLSVSAVDPDGSQQIELLSEDLDAEIVVP